jgi:hypothetical protein
MPTTTIVGYLWRNRKDLGIESIADALQVVSDLTRQGVPTVTLEDERLLGMRTGHVYTGWIKREPEEWATIVEKAIMESAVQNALDGMHHLLDEESDAP